MLGYALVADLIPSQAMGVGISRFDASTWLGAIIGFGVSGVIIQSVGMTTTIMVAALLPLIAVTLLIPIRPMRQTLRPA